MNQGHFGGLFMEINRIESKSFLMKVSECNIISVIIWEYVNCYVDVSIGFMNLQAWHVLHECKTSSVQGRVVLFLLFGLSSI